MEPFFPYCKIVSTLINMLSTVVKKRRFGFGVFFFINSSTSVLQGELFTLYFQINIRLVYFKQNVKGQEPAFLCRSQMNSHRC